MHLALPHWRRPGIALVPAATSETIYDWRLRWISEPALRLVRRALPRMSRTEREALDAGTVWWDGELFSGKPRWRLLRQQEPPTLTREEQAFLDGPVEELCRIVDDWEVTHERHDLPPKVWHFIRDNGFFGMIIPRTYGGLEFSALAHSAVVMKIATRSVSAAVTVMVPNSLGPAKLLLEYGTEEQKDHYLPRLAQGKEVPCFALTSPEAGSDAGAIPDFGIVCRQDFEEHKDVLGIKLTWEKRYITLGPVATLLGLAFKLYDPDHLLGEEEDLGITLALIPTDTAGVVIGRRHMPLNQVFMNGPNSGKDVFVPIEWIIGGLAYAGQGWRMLMECLADGRSISLPALGTGAGKLASRAVGAYGRIRRQFKQPIGRFEGVQEALARIGGYTYMMDSARVLTARAIDSGEKPSVISAIVKYHLTEGMRRVVNDAMDVLGGAGICLGPRNLLGRTYQAVPISITVEGANILTRTMIIFGQGAVRSHPYIFHLMEAASNEESEKSLQKFDRALFGHMRYLLGNLLRTFFHATTGARFARVPGRGSVRRYYQHLTRMSASFALLADAAILTLGGSLKRRERISGRLADVISQLYLASAALQRFNDQGEPQEDLPFVRWVCDQSLHTIQSSLSGVLSNLPNRPVAWMLRWVIFPYGRRFNPPTDRLGQEIAEMLLAPSAARDRLTDGMFIPTGLEDQLGRIEDALDKVIRAEYVERKLRKELAQSIDTYRSIDDLVTAGLAQGILDASDAELITSADAARREVIRVDDFPNDLGKEADHD
ncbi:MAG: acyl-CoA dehydrogenase [Pseudomonadota bacterium]|nr:MAG: acyl-CoA dehydrogenase [Pseudomonadota bacterium]